LFGMGSGLTKGYQYVKKTPHWAGLVIGPRFFLIIALNRGKKRQNYRDRFFLLVIPNPTRPIPKSARVPGSGTATATADVAILSNVNS
jgi:hypothetical protein